MLTSAFMMLVGTAFLMLRLGKNIGSFPKPLSAEEERHYLELMAQGDMDARNTLIEHNLRLVAHIVKKYYTQASEVDDLISIGTIGLIKGISSYRADKGVRLATYASRCVENAILSQAALLHFYAGKKPYPSIPFSAPPGFFSVSFAVRITASSSLSFCSVGQPSLLRRKLTASA